MDGSNENITSCDDENSSNHSRTEQENPKIITVQQRPPDNAELSIQFRNESVRYQHWRKKGPLKNRWEYLKMIFDFKEWQKDSVATLGSTVSGIYATMLVCVYLTFAYTELVKFPELQDYLEKKGFFIYLFAGCDLYFIYVLVIVARASRNGDNENLVLVVENHKSHGSLTVRYGAIIFGLGTFVNYFIELLVYIEHEPDSPCLFHAIGANASLALIFVFLQTFLIFMYPRLNFQRHKFFNRLATMHLVATNIIIWIRTLIKESLEEIEEYEVESSSHSANDEVADTESGDPQRCDFLRERMLLMEHFEQQCKAHSRNFLIEDLELRSSPYLYPFIIEYSLIGASVAYIMSNHIGVMPQVPRVAVNKVRIPQPVSCFRKSNLNHTFKGLLVGLLIVVVAIVNLVLFFGLGGAGGDEAEYVSKISNSIINMVGILALIIGIAELHHLEHRQEAPTFDLDMALLRFTSFFSFMYMVFTIITGAFNQHVEDFPNELHVINGALDLIQIFLQLCFIASLKQKAYIAEDQDYIMPGRQVTVFLFLFNLAQWVVFTFEIQKVRASKVEEEFYGFMPWVIIRRVTLPLAVFFRFHSAVVSIELWKEVYSPKEEELESSQASQQQELTRIPRNSGDS